MGLHSPLFNDIVMAYLKTKARLARQGLIFNIGKVQSYKTCTKYAYYLY